MEPCDLYFQSWWRFWLKQQTGVAEIHDLVATRYYWEMSLALQKSLGGLDD